MSNLISSRIARHCLVDCLTLRVFSNALRKRAEADTSCAHRTRSNDWTRWASTIYDGTVLRWWFLTSVVRCSSFLRTR